MNTTDIILLLPILFGFIRGAWNGLISEVAGIVGVIAGLIAGYMFNEEVVYWLQDQFDMNIESANVVGFVVLFLGVFAAVLILAKILTKGVSMASLGPLNRLLGGVFGALKYGVFTILLLTAFNRINDSITFVPKEKLAESSVYELYSELSSVLWEYVPEDSFQLDEFRESIEESIEDRLNAR